MNIAITGSSGLLGSHLTAALSAHHRVVGFDRHTWWGSRPIELHQGNVEDAIKRAAFLDSARPDLLIHCAAMMNLDACEEHPADAYFINGTVTGQLVRAVPSHCRVVYVTTDGIFSGNSSMQRESDLPCPRTVYGRSKLHGEWETLLASDKALVIRTNFFGWSAGVKSSFAEWLYQSLATRTPITLFDDFWYSPIYVVDLVERILALCSGNHTGIFHVVGSERISKYAFGMQLATAAGFSTDHVRRGSIENAAMKVPRPRDMSLNPEKVVVALGRAAPDCREGVQRFMAHKGLSLEERMVGQHAIISA